MTMKPTPVLLALTLSLAPAWVAGAERPEAGPPAAAAERNGDPSQGYRLGPGDVIEVFVWKEPELSTTAAVRPDGRISLPLAGEMEAAKRTAAELEEQLTARLEQYIEVPVVTVIVREVNSPRIAVLGEVRRPGRYLVAQRTTVLDAIAMGGGFTEFADRGNVVVLRPTPSGTKRIRVNVKRLLRDGATPLYLEPEDTVYVD